MPLKLHLKTQLNVPLNVDRVLPETVGAEDFRSITVEEGNHTGQLSDYFAIEGSAAEAVSYTHLTLPTIYSV